MGKIRRQWTRDQMEEALSEIHSGNSVSSVSKRFGIPRTTLLSKKSGQVPPDATFGPNPVLTKMEEKNIVQWILYCKNRNFPITKNQLIMSVAQLLKEQKRETPFKDGIPGRNWYSAFLRRHPDVSTKISQNLTPSRLHVNESILRNWFAEVQKNLRDNNLMDVDASRIFNCDESAIYLCPKGNRIRVRKGEKVVYNFIMNDEKECITTLLTVNAAGSMVPPMVVYSYERYPYNLRQNFPKDWIIGKSNVGWMSEESFLQYMKNVFEPWLTKNNIQRPVVFFIDGYSCHLTMLVVEFCILNKIHLIATLPNATHLIQPLDVGLFNALNEIWKENVKKFTMQNKGKVCREHFAQLLRDSLEQIDAEVIANGFADCGLYPFNPDAIQYDKLTKKCRRIVDEANVEVILTEESPFEIKEDNIALNMLEKEMDQDLLKSFKMCQESGVWNGAVEQVGLFSLWIKLVNQTKHNSF